MYLLRKQTNYSLSEIGREIGGRNPSTVSHACDKIENAVNDSPYLKRKVREISEGMSSRQ